MVLTRKGKFVNQYGLLVLAVWLLSGCATHTATSGRVVLKDEAATTATAGRVVQKNEAAATVIRFSAEDRKLIENYFRNSPAKSASNSLPLIRGGWLPTNTRTESLPSVLERKLTTIPATHSRQKVGRDVVIMEMKTRTILDVIFDVTK